MRNARVPVPARPADAALRGAMRGLVGPSAEGGRAAEALGDQVVPTGRRRGARARGRIRILTPARAAGLLGMLATGFLFTFATGPTAFALSRTDLPALSWTDPATVDAALALPAGINAFQLDTAPLEAALRALPAVADADVSVALPDAALVVSIQERQPVLAWQADDRWFIADGTGVIFAIVDVDAALPAGVAVVDDRRGGAGIGLQVGGHLDAVDVDVATRLGSVTPADIGSTANRLRVIVTDEDGFTISATAGWQAVFGFYSPAIRSTDMIPGQVRLLRDLIDGREAAVRRVVLASATDGTYVPRSTPKASSR
jgi:POTRA domain-containing FtsQ-type protein